VTLSLNEETDKILDDFKVQSKVPKSEIIRKVLLFFSRNPKQLKDILVNDIKIGECVQ